MQKIKGISVSNGISISKIKKSLKGKRKSRKRKVRESRSKRREVSMLLKVQKIKLKISRAVSTEMKKKFSRHILKCSRILKL